jgi:hypothetical protein
MPRKRNSQGFSQMTRLVVLQELDKAPPYFQKRNPLAQITCAVFVGMKPIDSIAKPREVHATTNWNFYHLILRDDGPWPQSFANHVSEPLHNYIASDNYSALFH